MYVYRIFEILMILWRMGSEEWRRLQNEELRNLYRSFNMVMVIKSTRLRWAEWKVGLLSKIYQVHLQERDCEGLGVDGTTVLELLLKC